MYMSDINSVCISGRLADDPVIWNIGHEAAYFTLASKEFYRDQTGAWQLRKALVHAQVFGEQAQAVQNRRKWDMVMVAGRLRSEGDGSQLVLICDSVKFLRPARRHERGSSSTRLPSVAQIT